MDMGFTTVLQLAVAADIITAVTGALIGAEVELYTNDVLPVPTSVIGDFDLATYTGYAAEAVAWLAPAISDSGEVEVVGIVGEFRPTNSAVPNDVYGFILTDGAGVLLGGGRFTDGPLPMNSALDQIIITPRVRPLVGGIGEVVS